MEPAPAATASALPASGTARVIDRVRALPPVTDGAAAVETHALPPETATSVGRPGRGTASSTRASRASTAATELVATSRAGVGSDGPSAPRLLRNAPADAPARRTPPARIRTPARERLLPLTPGAATPSAPAAARIISPQRGQRSSRSLARALRITGSTFEYCRRGGGGSRRWAQSASFSLTRRNGGAPLKHS